MVVTDKLEIMATIVLRSKLTSSIDTVEARVHVSKRVSKPSRQRSSLLLNEQLGTVRSACSAIKDLIDVRSLRHELVELADIAERFVVRIDVELVSFKRFGLHAEHVMHSPSGYDCRIGRQPRVEEREVRQRREPQILVVDAPRKLDRDVGLNLQLDCRSRIDRPLITEIEIARMHTALQR